MSTSGPQPPASGYDPSSAAAQYEILVGKAMDSTREESKPRVNELFEVCLMDNLRDGVIFVDSRLRIQRWNRSVEAMTGTSSQKAIGGPISPDLLRLHNTKGEPVPQAACPFGECIRIQEPVEQEFNVIGRSGRSIRTFLTVSPVIDGEGKIHGAIAQLQDLSVQTDLQRQLRDLYAISMLDPLTSVANRAEFERMLDEYVKAHTQADLPCSLIICDIDFFKSINDNFGHHIGDQALIAFAQLLKEFVRQQDIVARYGGEEFVILCANCTRDAAVDRAEQIRARLNTTSQSVLDGKCLTASFGVSQLQRDEQPDSFFVRADQALLHAKASGRNRVICAERMSRKSGRTQEPPSITGMKWRSTPKRGLLESIEFKTPTPASVFEQKVRAYLEEVGGRVLSFKSGIVTAIVPSNWSGARQDEKFEVHMEYQEGAASPDDNGRQMLFIRITVLESRSRKSWFQRTPDVAPEAVQHLINELRRYTALIDESSTVMVKPVATKSTRDEH
ncbi:MAG: diguanylate cyclase [Planctomycetota bacterium]